MDQNGGPHNASSPGYSPPANRPINLHQGNSTQFNPIQPSIHRPPRVQSNAKFSKPNQAQSSPIKPAKAPSHHLCVLGKAQSHPDIAGLVSQNLSIV
jgi:hypothetical protein